MQSNDILGSKPIWEVSSVTPKKDYTLQLQFADGSDKVYDASPLLDKPIYAPLKNLSFFMEAKVEYGTVVWNEDIDLAPDHLYECSLPSELKTTKK